VLATEVANDLGIAVALVEQPLDQRPPRTSRPECPALLGFDCGEPGVFSGEWIDRILVSRT